MGALKRIPEPLDIVGEQVAAVLDLHQPLIELSGHVVEALCQPTDLIGSHDRQAHRQVPSGRLLGGESDGHHRHGHLAGQPPHHRRSERKRKAQQREQQPGRGHSVT